MRILCAIAAMALLAPAAALGQTADAGPVFEIGALGKFRLAKAEEGDRFPPGCEPSPTCQPAKEGYKVIVLWVEPSDGRDPGNVGIELFDATAGLRVVAKDGSATERFSAGLLEGGLFIAFTPETGDEAFVLEAPNLKDGLPLAPSKRP